MTIKLSAAALLLLVVHASLAFAITAKDVAEKMSKEERFSYLTGLVDMLAYQAVLAGNRAHAKCVVDKFYDDKRVLQLVYDSLKRFPDKAPEGIVILIMKDECGR